MGTTPSKARPDDVSILASNKPVNTKPQPCTDPSVLSLTLTLVDIPDAPGFGSPGSFRLAVEPENGGRESLDPLPSTEWITLEANASSLWFGRDIVEVWRFGHRQMLHVVLQRDERDVEEDRITSVAETEYFPLGQLLFDEEMTCEVPFRGIWGEMRVLVKATLDPEEGQKFGVLDFFKTTLKIQLMIAIDFTGSNGNPTSPDSLHRAGINPYSGVMSILHETLQPFLCEKIMMYGFGARMANGTVSHCFAMNGREDAPFVESFEEIEQVYRASLQTVRLYGPTYFSQIVEKAAEIAQQQPMTPETHVFTLLLILTDGIVRSDVSRLSHSFGSQINDYDRTLSSLQEAVKLPLGVRVVGVGGADFTAMQDFSLDGLDIEKENGAFQFVPYHETPVESSSLPATLFKFLDARILHCLYEERGFLPGPAKVSQNSVAALFQEKLLFLLSEDGFLWELRHTVLCSLMFVDDVEIVIPKSFLLLS